METTGLLGILFFGVYVFGGFIVWGGWQFYRIPYEDLDEKEKTAERQSFLFVFIWILSLKVVSLFKVFTVSKPLSLTQFEVSLIVLAGLLYHHFLAVSNRMKQTN